MLEMKIIGLTGLLFRGDAKLAQSAVWLDGWFDGTSVFGGTRNWRGARFRWMCL